ncbi:MAG: hypothetical protein H6815_11035 [Phycisphaeraceae bacterium]|nr:hypothetical protein [Phycisphaerales bacterium]MCB9860970.1 hypothetical protein [Phycisphaeraceae bacterium]
MKWVFHHAVRSLRVPLLVLCFGALQGCITVPYWNPDFPATRELVREEMLRMEQEHVDRPRPLVILSGYRSPWIAADVLGVRLQALAHIPDDQILVMSYPFATSIPDLAERAVKNVEKHWPSSDPNWTTEVDVIGYSMGGIVARLAATDPMPCSCGSTCRCNQRKRLRIHTLYTLASPHTGAVLADFGTTSSAVRDMTRGSKLLTYLDEALKRNEYELVCYAVLEDKIVGSRRTYPQGHLPYWVSGWIIASHFQIVWDGRVITDLALRLRGETPISIKPTLPPRHE